MNRALVTGGGGFVGLAVVKKLRAMGVETSVVGRHRYPAAEEHGARCQVGDIRNMEFLQQAVKDHDTVFHVAAKAGIWGDWESYHSINVLGTQNVIESCRLNGVRHLVYTSTPSVVFDGHDLKGGDETLPYSCNPLCYYARTKIEAERRILAANSEKLKTTALRPHLIWGPGDTQIIPRLIRRGQKGQLRIVGAGRNLVDISYIDNVADAHILAAQNLASAETAAGESFFISQGEPVNLWDWINELFNKIGVPVVRRKISFRSAYRAGWMMEKIYTLLRRPGEPRMTRFLAEQLAMSHWFTIAKAEKFLAYSPEVSTEEGVGKLVAWLLQTDGREQEK